MSATTYDVKIVILPCDHFAGARFTRRTWIASLAWIANDEQIVRCEHRMGHNTTAAAIACGRKLYDQHERNDPK